MIEETVVNGEKALLVHTEEEFHEACGREFDNDFGSGTTILPATLELARQMGCPEEQEHEPPEAQDLT